MASSTPQQSVLSKGPSALGEMETAQKSIDATAPWDRSRAAQHLPSCLSECQRNLFRPTVRLRPQTGFRQQLLCPSVSRRCVDIRSRITVTPTQIQSHVIQTYIQAQTLTLWGLPLHTDSMLTLVPSSHLLPIPGPASFSPGCSCSQPLPQTPTFPLAKKPFLHEAFPDHLSQRGKALSKQLYLELSLT